MASSMKPTDESHENFGKTCVLIRNLNMIFSQNPVKIAVVKLKLNTEGLVITPRQGVAITPSSRKILCGNDFYIFVVFEEHLTLCHLIIFYR